MAMYIRVWLFRAVLALPLAAVFQTVQPGAALAANANERLVGIWLGLQGKYQFPAECESGAPVRYSADGMYLGPGARGTWQLREGRLTETATEVYERT